MKTLIDFTTAKLLKEKKYYQENTYSFNSNNSYSDSEMFATNKDYFSNEQTKEMYFKKLTLCLKPTIAEAVMWVYEKHGIWIEVIETDLFNKFFFQIKRKDNTKLKNGDYSSPTEAYQEAIKYCLTNLIMKEELE